MSFAPFDPAAVDQARADFDLEMIMARLARVPTRVELARTALGIIFSTAVLVIGWIELFWRHCLRAEHKPSPCIPRPILSEDASLAFDPAQLL